MNPLRVLLVDDHQIVRQGLLALISSDPQFEVVGQVSTGAEALQLVKKHTPDIALMDLRLPDIDGIELCRRIRQVSPHTAVLILTAYIEPSLVNACLQAGARGYLLKDAENLHLKEHFLAVGQGYHAYDPRAASMIADFARRRGTQRDVLKPREIEILRLVARGLSNREISGQLSLSEHTVKGYMKDILDKLEVSSRVEAVMVARERGIL